jgi:hypothetical protein
MELNKFIVEEEQFCFYPLSSLAFVDEQQLFPS